MRFGYSALIHANGVAPGRLAAELEDRGFDSIWVTEHSHIPTSRRTPYPGGDPMPEYYKHMMDPLVSLTAAASATSRLRLCTGVCLILEHDLLALACATASLDVISEGRLTLGVGVGWNAEELANHRPDLPFPHRYRAMVERVAALRAAWTHEHASFDGRWDRFESSWLFPKPRQTSIPVALGNSGPIGIDLAAMHADEWCPIDAVLVNAEGRRDVAGAVRSFRNRVEQHGRDPRSIAISLFTVGQVSAQRLERYSELDVDRVVLPFPPGELPDASAILHHLDSLSKMTFPLQ